MTDTPTPLATPSTPDPPFRAMPDETPVSMRASMEGIHAAIHNPDAVTHDVRRVLINLDEQVRLHLVNVGRTIAQNRQTIRFAHSDLNTIALALKEEARERNWCDEYDTFCDTVNGDTHGQWLEKCASNYDVVVTVTITVEARNEEQASEIAGRQLDEASNSFDDVEYDIQDVNEA
jgi:hypothetical protein